MALLLAWFACACLFIVHVSGDGVEDFAFDSDSPTEPLHRLWGIPDTSANVGQLFRFTVPANAFSGVIVRYQAGGGAHDRLLPEWLNFDERSGVFEGVPGEEDLGEHYVAVEAIDTNMKDRIRDVFAIDVTHNPIPKEKCKPSEDTTVLTLVLDKAYKDIDSKHKVTAIKNLAGFLGLHWSKLSLFPQSPDAELLSEAVMSAGPGNVKKKLAAGSTVILWQVGCNGAVWKEQTRPLDELKQNARDGTLAEVLQLPVIGWHGSIAAEIDAARERRQVVAGSGELDSEWEEEPPQRIIPSLASPVFPSSASPHPHRHHHGDYVELAPTSTPTPSPASPAIPYGSIMATPTLIPERPRSLYVVETLPATPGLEYVLTPTPSLTLSIEPTPSAIPETTPSPTSTTTTTQAEPDAESVPLPTETSQVVDTTTTTEQTTPSLPQGSTASSGEDEVEYETKNFPPTIQHRIRKQAVTAGKPLRLVIPEDTFTDLEDGNTRNLQLSFKTQEGAAVPPSSWIQFNSKSQEIYALPLEEQVSKWAFVVSAMDSDGASVSDGLEVLVQHHKGRRTVTHAISLELELGAPARSMPSPVDWQLRLVDGLAALYGDSDARLITVLAVNLTAQPVTFTFTNDSLPRSHCPTQQIQDNIKVLSNSEGLPVLELNRLLEPLVTVQRVMWQGLGQCEARQPEPLPPQLTNYPPVTRNQVDQLNATIGQLLLYTVPEDSFYDPEDGSARNLKLSLMTMDRTPIHPTHWLQFDVKNQEFYGIPSTTGRTEYQLVCEDSGGLMANDGLVVVVQPAPKAPYNVEFRMTLGLEYETFMMSPATQRHFVERLAELFGDPDTGAIVLSGFSPGSTLLIWHNRTLPTDVCPDDEINRLRQVLIGEDERVSVAAARVMGPELPVLSAGLTPIGMCQGALTEVHETGVAGGGNEVRPVAGTSSGDHYLVTLVVPAVVIAAMLVCAGLVACVLYRRRSTGKMSVGDEDERHSFRSKGIPVIFQDELEERPEPTNKSPVIMKEEKPPLPPPEYQRTLPSATTALLSDTEDCPYHPPPPFTSSRDSARPKPTPTYRMPPPYVPP